MIANEFADRASAGAWAGRLNMRVPDSDALAGAAYEAGFLMVDVSKTDLQFRPEISGFESRHHVEEPVTEGEARPLSSPRSAGVRRRWRRG